MKTSKKGFTIVELTIVIAVIAILAAVLIPTFVSLVNKANNSADVQMVTNINKYLAALEVTDGKNKTMHDAMLDAKDAGYDLTQPIATNTILWNQETDRFLAVNENNKIVASDVNAVWGDNENDKGSIEPSYIYWTITGEKSVFDNQVYSIYWIGRYEENVPYTAGGQGTLKYALKLTSDLKVGLDTGEHSKDWNYVVIMWNNESQSEASDKFVQGENIILNGTFSELNVVGKNVHHYGAVRNQLKLFNGSEYYEHGFVAKLKDYYGGKFVADGAKFHQQRDEILNTITEEYKDQFVETSAEYGVHYFNENGFCYVDNQPEHTHSLEQIMYTPVSCTDNGFRLSQCECGYMKAEDLGKKLGHDWKDNPDTPAKAATCEDAGHTAAQYCSRCSETKNPEYIAPMGHEWDKDGKCVHEGCDQSRGDVEEKITQSKVEEMLKDGKSFVKDSNGFCYITLGDNVTISNTDFDALFTINYSFTWKGEPVEAAETKADVVIYLDIDLNGYDLTITNSENNDNFILVERKLRIVNSGVDKNEVSFASGDNYPINLGVEGATVEFDNISVIADTSNDDGALINGVGLMGGLENTTIKITKCELHKIKRWGTFKTMWLENYNVDSYSENNIHEA